MTATLTAATTTGGATARPALWAPGVAASLAAAVATATTVALADAAGIAMAVRGEAFPLLGVAQLTVMLSLVGVIMAAALRRRAARPRRTFVRTAVALTAVSLGAPWMLPTDAATISVLMLTHVVAAAIVIPAVATRLR
jgi:Family of unknown function (DUF6069)